MAGVEGWEGEGEEGEFVFGRGSFVTRPAGGDGGLVDVGVEFCEREDGVDCFWVWVWAWFWAGWGGAPSVLTTVTVGSAVPPAVKYSDKLIDQMDNHIKVQSAKRLKMNTKIKESFATCGVQTDHRRAATVWPLSRPVDTGHAESDGALRW